MGCVIALLLVIIAILVWPLTLALLAAIGIASLLLAKFLATVVLLGVAGGIVYGGMRFAADRANSDTERPRHISAATEDDDDPPPPRGRDKWNQ